jgi:hypothetical protein
VGGMLEFRCKICRGLLKLTELFASIRQQGRLTHPRRRPDGTRVEHPVRYLCERCRERAPQRRGECQSTNPAVPPDPG